MSHPVENLVVWNDALSLQLPEVDHQHQILINIINQIWRQLVHTSSHSPSVESLLEDLQGYTEVHFTAEEHLMHSFEYPHLARHQVSHREFVAHIQRAREDHLAGKPIALDLLHFLNDWLIHHIKVVDRDYANFIANKQAGGIFKRFSSMFQSLGSILKGGEASSLKGETLLEGLDMRQAIRSHVEWRERLANHVEGRSTEVLMIHQVARDDLCLLGNWIKLRADEGWGRLPDFHALQTDHREFHLCAGQVLSELDAGNPQQALLLLRTDLRRLSDRVRFDIIQLYGTVH